MSAGGGRHFFEEGRGGALSGVHNWMLQMSLERIDFSRNTRIELGCGYKAAKKFVSQ